MVQKKAWRQWQLRRRNTSKKHEAPRDGASEVSHRLFGFGGEVQCVLVIGISLFVQQFTTMDSLVRVDF
jgi:hypothetical protein